MMFAEKCFLLVTNQQCTNMVSDVCEFFCWQVMSVKALGTSLKLTFEGNNQLVYPQTWFFMLVVAICVVMQMNYLNKVCY